MDADQTGVPPRGVPPRFVPLTIDRVKQFVTGCSHIQITQSGSNAVRIDAECAGTEGGDPSYIVFRDQKVALFYEHQSPIVMMRLPQ